MYIEAVFLPIPCHPSDIRLSPSLFLTRSHECKSSYQSCLSKLSTDDWFWCFQNLWCLTIYMNTYNIINLGIIGWMEACNLPTLKPTHIETKLTTARGRNKLNESKSFYFCSSLLLAPSLTISVSCAISLGAELIGRQIRRSKWEMYNSKCRWSQRQKMKW